tara:strand:- start:284 stop:511 length:228 start_codon:yes stop_codon:yes gene_type:complete
MDIFHISLPVSHGPLDKEIRRVKVVETVKGTGNRNMERKEEIEEVDINEKYGRNFTEQYTLQVMGVVVISPPMGL